jgi:hypothetical protein
MNQPTSPLENTDPATLWSAVLSKLASKVNPQVVDTWFRPIVCAGWDETSLSLNVPNDIFRIALSDNYGNLLRQTAAEIIGAATDLHIAVPTAEPEPAASPGSLPVVQAAALQQSAPGCRWLIEQLWTDQAVGFLGAPPKHYKTWMAMEMAVSVASGAPCLGSFPVPSPGPVLLYAAEDSASEVRRRLEALTRHRRVELGRLALWVITADSLHLDRPEDREKLEATVIRYQPRLLVLDPLVRLHQLDENASGPMAALLGFFRSLQRKTGAAIALVHHTRKNPAAAGYSLRGSSDFYAWTDSFLHLQRRRGQLTLTAEHRSAPSFGPVALELAHQDDTHAHLELVADTTPATVAPGSDPPDNLNSRILDLLSTSPQTLPVAQLRSRLRIRNQRLVEALRQLCSQGKIQRVDNGYAIKPAP